MMFHLNLHHITLILNGFLSNISCSPLPFGLLFSQVSGIGITFFSCGIAHLQFLLYGIGRCMVLHLVRHKPAVIYKRFQSIKKFQMSGREVNVSDQHSWMLLTVACMVHDTYVSFSLCLYSLLYLFVHYNTGLSWKALFLLNVTTVFLKRTFNNNKFKCIKQDLVV